MSSKQKHIPQRMCVICREKYEKQYLMRFVRVADGVFADPTGKRDGRGAYVCANPTCRERAAKSDVLSKALRASLSDSDRERIRDVVS